MRKKFFILFICIFSVLFLEGIFVLAQMFGGYGGKNSGYEPVPQAGRQDENSIIKNMPVNLLILGLDDEETRSDVIMLLNYSPQKAGVNILSVARDTKVRSGGMFHKINSLIGSGGEQLTIKKVEELTGLNIDYYITVNFKGFRKMIDTLGGVKINVPINMDYDDPGQGLHIHLKRGLRTLDGDEAEQFVRYRKGNNPREGYIDGDIGRIEAQQVFLQALFEQKIKLKYISKITDLFSIFQKYIRTNIGLSDVNYYFRNIRNIKGENIKTFTIPGDSAYEDRVWYFIYDKEKLRELINSSFYTASNS